MAHYLKVLAGTDVDGDTVPVSWDAGKQNRRGVCNVDVSQAGASTELSNNDKAIVAELVATRFLIFRKKVFGGAALLAGDKLTLVVSKGAIKRWAEKRSDKRDIYSVAYFLSSRLAGATIQVDKSAVSMGEREPERDVIAPEAEPLEPFFSVALGADVVISQHAFERFSQAQVSGAIQTAHPNLTLCKMLSRADSLERVNVPEKVRRHKERAYGDSDEATHWRLKGTALSLIVGPELVKPTVLRVITVYQRAQRYANE